MMKMKISKKHQMQKGKKRVNSTEKKNKRKASVRKMSGSEMK